MLKTTVLSLSAIALLATGCVMEDLGDEAQATHAWGNYHWARTSNPFTLKLGDNVDNNWQQYLVDADNDWTSSNVLNTTIVAGSTSPRRCNATTGMVEVCNAAYGNNGWLGIAGIYASGDHITKGYVKLNDTYYASATYNTPEWRRMVMCQEIGHTFGLGHQDENFNNANLNTCMDYTNSPSSNQHPNNHDYQMLSDIYSHLDSTTTVGFGADNTATEEVVDGDWGELIAISASGNTETYLKDLGNGETLTTHVTWADGAHTIDTGHTH